MDKSTRYGSGGHVRVVEFILHTKKYLKKKLRELDRKLHYLGLLCYYEYMGKVKAEYIELDLERKRIRNLIKYYERNR